MTTEEYRKLWKEAIHLCEIEPNREEAVSFVYSFYDKYPYPSFSNKELLLTFIGLVVYEKKYNLHFGSTTPASKCYRELLDRIGREGFDKEFIYDVGDWAAAYSDNGYIPMDNYRGYGPRQYFKFRDELESRIACEQKAKEERIARLREEGRKRVETAKSRHQKRLDTIANLRTKSVKECIQIIENSQKPVFYYIELIEEWFKSKTLDDFTKTHILSLFPLNSTKHNIRLRKKVECLL